jgi:hypothetical protein
LATEVGADKMLDMRRIRWISGLALAGCGGEVDGNEPESAKVAACRQVFTAACETLVRCGAFPEDFDCEGEMRDAPDSRFSGCAGHLVDSFTQAQVDTCSDDMLVVECADICGQVPLDPPSCQELDPEPNTEVLECTY